MQLRAFTATHCGQVQRNSEENPEGRPHANSDADGRINGKRDKIGFVPVHVLAQRLIEEYLAMAKHFIILPESCVKPEFDLGPRAGSGQTQDLHGGYECESLVLRSTQPLAARHERKHEPVTATILAEKK